MIREGNKKYEFAPRAELCTLRRMFTPSFNHRGEHYCLQKWRGKQDDLNPQGPTSPLKVKCHPGGEIKKLASGGNYKLAKLPVHLFKKNPTLEKTHKS
jgi:hypothetical protein